ncbi:MAG TPA: hypothetical protein ENG62_03260 [Thermoplasmatales archaeon]|nr:hypothetical protein [Thermoplasmatales archaeon]
MRVISTIECDSEKQAEVIASALTPETGREIPRTEVELERKGRVITLIISAPEVPPLRAACNSYLRWIQTALSVSEIE